MTIIRDGEKFSCRQCIAGHRVSTCTHEERPLLHVARKGRPVSQCPHCRGLRKARAQHVKCECGERRLSSHSRNNSSESASTTDEKTCQCFQGKRCSCALKKEPGTYEPNLTIPRPGLGPFLDRDTGKPSIPNRRSEGSVPRSRNTYQPNLERSGRSAQEIRRPYQYLSSPLARNYHQVQRSVDSLPLFLNNTTSIEEQPALPPTAFHQANPFFHPEEPAFTLQSQQAPPDVEVPSFGRFDVDPLVENVLERTLSPRNPNRHSIGGTISAQWAQLMENTELYKPGGHEDLDQTYYASQPANPNGYPFPMLPQLWPSTGQQASPQQSVTSNHATRGQFSHSRSSSGDMSESFEPPAYAYNSSHHFSLQVDPSPIWQLSNDEKTWSTAYSDVHSDYNWQGDTSLPQYDDYSVADTAEYSDYGYTFPASSNSRTDSIDSVPTAPSLPDRSIQYSAGSNSLPQFKFPPDPAPHAQVEDTPEDDQHVEHLDWQSSGQDKYIKEEGASPSAWNGYG